MRTIGIIVCVLYPVLVQGVLCMRRWKFLSHGHAEGIEITRWGGIDNGTVCLTIAGKLGTLEVGMALSLWGILEAMLLPAVGDLFEIE